MGKAFNKFAGRGGNGRGGGGGSWRGSRGRGRGRGGHTGGAILKTEQDVTRMDDRQEDSKVSRSPLSPCDVQLHDLTRNVRNVQAWDELDEKLGFPKLSQGAPRQGWLVNMKEVSTRDLSLA